MAFDLQQALRVVVEEDGSDLHIKVPSRPLMRLQGRLTPLDDTEGLTPDRLHFSGFITRPPFAQLGATLRAAPDRRAERLRL